MRKYLVGVIALLALTLTSPGLVAVASGSSNPWQNAAARVTFPVYQPTETLGFKLTRVNVQQCGYGGNTSVDAGYSKGSGKQRAVFGLTEASPQFCGDAGESITVGSADVNGIEVPVQVFCYSPGPKCTVEDGFTNGFLLYVRRPGSNRTVIAAYSSHVALDDLLKVVRSLAGVSKPVAASPPASTASGRCSKAEATAVAKRLHLGNADSLSNPVFQVLCGAFLGPGSRAMVASLSIPSCGRTAGWVVLRWTGGAWQLVLTRNNGADLAAVGSDIRETMFVLRPGDAHCFPTGGTRARTWHWNGVRFVASAWKQVAPGKATAPAGAATGGYFKTPSGNIQCGYVSTGVYCGIKSGLNPPPPSRGPGCSRSNRVSLGATGRTHTGRSICPGEDEGDAGPFAGEGVARVLGYGTTWSGGGVRCTSAATGLTCRNRSGHGFFLSRERWRAY